MTFNMKKENFRRIGNWNVAFALLFLFSAAHRRRTQEKGLEVSNPTIKESTGMPVTQQNERTIKGVVKRCYRRNGLSEPTCLSLAQPLEL